MVKPQVGILASSFPGVAAPETTVLGPGNVACAINNHGIIAGQSALSDNTTFHPVLWQDGIIADLGVLPGDLVGAALNLNNRGAVVDASVSAPGPATGPPMRSSGRMA